MRKSIIISGKDKVGVALAALSKGEIAEGVTLAEDIERGHKFALVPIKSGEDIIKESIYIRIIWQRALRARLSIPFIRRKRLRFLKAPRAL